MYEWFGTKSRSGEMVSEESALRLAAVAACVRIISNTIAGVPKYLLEESANGDLNPAKTNPLYFQLSEQPSELYNKYNFDRMMLTYRLLYGNAYAYIHRNQYNEPIGRTILYPWAISTIFENGKLYFYNSDTRYSDIPRVMEPWQIYHLKNTSIDGYTGKSPIRLHAESIGINIASESYGAKFFGNSAIPSGYIKVPTNINPAQRDQIKESWKKDSSGEASSGTAVLGSGADFVRLSVPPEEAQFLETRKYGVREIASIYGVPLHMLADLERATFSNIEHQTIQFVSGTLSEYTNEIEWEDESKLLTRDERLTHEVRYDYSNLLKGDVNSQMDYIIKGIQNGLFSIDDGRKFLGKNSVEGGNQRFINLQMLPIEQVSTFHMAGKQPVETKSNSEVVGFIKKQLDEHFILNKDGK